MNSVRTNNPSLKYLRFTLLCSHEGGNFQEPFVEDKNLNLMFSMSKN